LGAAAPLQQAGVLALNMPDSYYEKLARDYQGRRDMLLGILGGAGFRCFRPDRAYYIMTDIGDFKFADDYAFVRHMIEQARVATVPGSGFFANCNDGATLIRFCFCKKYETLEEAGVRLKRI
jgi:aspartate/methionine/tyrosine aminotransferase